jgi:hypothetical protein
MISGRGGGCIDELVNFLSSSWFSDWVTVGDVLLDISSSGEVMGCGVGVAG